MASSSREKYAPAYAKIGGAHYFGIYGKEENPEEGVRYFFRAAELGDTWAMRMLTSAYREGKGVERDNQKVIYWLKEGASLGDALPMIRLGSKYEYGQEFPKDYVLAYMWFNLAVAVGSVTRVAAEAREEVAKLMAPEQIAEAQRLTRDCVKKQFKGC